MALATALVLLTLTAALPLAAAQMPTPAQCCGTAGPGPACPGGSASGAGRFCGNGPTGKNILFLAAVRSCPLPASFPSAPPRLLAPPKSASAFVAS